MARVLVVGFCVVPGPDRHGVQLLHVVRALASRYLVDVLTLRVGELAYVERFQKTRMLRVPVPDASLAARVESFRRAVRRQLDGAEYDVVHFRDAWAGLPVMDRRLALGYKTVFDVSRSAQGDAMLADGPLAAELAHDETLCWEHADLVLTATESGRRFLTQRLPDDRADRVVVVPPGVDADRFDAEPGDDDGVPTVLYAGPLTAGRGVRVLLRAFRDVLQIVPARLVLCGGLDRDFMEPLGTALDQLQLQPHVELLGAIDNEDLPRVIARATVCVAPAAADLAERPTACFPTKVLEYLACRRAVLAPRRTSVRELIQDNVEGLLFDPQSPKDLADKILRLFGDPGLRERLADAGQRRVRARYPASLTRRRLLEAYLPLLPASTWNPIGLAAPRMPLPQTGSNSSANVHAALDRDAGIVSDTNPALRGGEYDVFGGDGDTGSTVITHAPVEQTMPGALPTGGEAAADAEPWLVIAGDGSITRVPRPGAGLDTDSGAGTPSDGIAPAPQPGPLGGRFVAGELDVPDDAPRVDTAPITPVAAVAAVTGDPPTGETLAFVAASDLLGGGETSDPQAATVRRDPPRES